MATAGELARAAQLGPLDEERLARNLYRRNAAEYRQTMLALGRRYGLERKRAALSAEIRQALRRESEEAARSISKTYNGYVEAFIERETKKGTTTEELIAKLPAYMRERKAARLRVIDRTATTNARLDAQVAFYRENGSEPLMRFAGPDPACPICKALRAIEPFPTQIALAVGEPHIGCRHRYVGAGVTSRELGEGGAKPDRITLGRGHPAGILGLRPLDLRTGGPEEAAQRIYALAGVKPVAA